MGWIDVFCGRSHFSHCCIRKDALLTGVTSPWQPVNWLYIALVHRASQVWRHSSTLDWALARDERTRNSSMADDRSQNASIIAHRVNSYTGFDMRSPRCFLVNSVLCVLFGSNSATSICPDSAFTVIFLARFCFIHFKIVSFCYSAFMPFLRD